MKLSARFSTAARNNIAGLILLGTAWLVMARFFPGYILPSPVAVFRASPGYINAAFWHQFALTMSRLMAGLSIALLFGSAFGIAAHMLHVRESLNSAMAALQAVPGIILGIILVLVLGIGSGVPIALVALLTLPTIAVNTANGLARRDAGLEEYLRSLGTRRRDLVRLFYLPTLVPTVQTNLTLGFGLSLKVIILGEFIGAQNGLGYLLNVAAVYFNMKEVLFYLCIVLLLTGLFEVAQSLAFGTWFARYFYTA